MARAGTRTRVNAKNSHGISLSTVLDLVGEARSAQQRREEELSVQVEVALDAPRDIAAAVKEILMPEQANARVRVAALGAGSAREEADLAVVVSGADAGAATERAVAWAALGVPCAIVCESALDAVEPHAAEPVVALISHVYASDGSALADGLASWALENSEKDIALAACFPAFRKCIANQLVGRCAVTCAGIGAVEFLKGADIVLMGASQAKLALDLAACYGRPVDFSRALEVGGVVGLSLAWREVARTLVDFAPGVSRLIKASVGYGGTVATGRALQALYEAGDKDPGALVDEIGRRIQALFVKDSPDDTLIRPLPVAAPAKEEHQSSTRDARFRAGYITLEG